MVSNKFEYGLDKEGGIKARPVPVSKEEISSCLETSAVMHQLREQIKNEYGAEKSNFKIEPEKPFENS